MSINLYTAKKYQVEYTQIIVPGYESQEVFDLIFSEFEVSTNKEDEYDNEYDLQRSELVRLRGEIVNQTDYFKEREAFLKEQLALIGLNVNKFVEVLNLLINGSDQKNECVLLSWY